MAVDAALIAAGTAVVGDFMSQQGAQANNAQNINVARMNNNFNARQAATNREFQQEMVGQQNEFSERMADTQMQRRVEDLKLAGLNPALAYTQGGAASPSPGAPGGSVASSAGLPNLQNPNLGFSNLGNQVSSALQLDTQKSQIALLQAQANKANQEAGAVIPAQVQAIQASASVDQARAQEIARNIKMLDIQLSPIDAHGGGMYGTIYENEAMQAHLKTDWSMMDNQERSETLATAIKARNDLNFAKSIGAENLYNASSGDWGKFMAYLSLMSPGATSAANAAVQTIGAVTAP